jgi:hypothetical protein
MWQGQNRTKVGLKPSAVQRRRPDANEAKSNQGGIETYAPSVNVHDPIGGQNRTKVGLKQARQSHIAVAGNGAKSNQGGIETVAAVTTLRSSGKIEPRWD